MRRGLLLLLEICLPAAALPAATVYFNQAAWQAAITANAVNSITNIGFDNSQWTDSLNVSRASTTLTSQSSTAASNGMSVSAVAGYSAPGYANNSTLGHVSSGAWTDTITKYGSTTFSFSQSIYGFGGDFDIAGANGLYISGAGDVGGGTDSGYDGFIGVVSDQPVDSILITWGQNCNPFNPFSNSYTLTDFQVASVPTPEPNFGYILSGLLILAVGCGLFRR